MPTDEFGRTALHHAADGGAEEAVALLLARGARVDATDDYGTTPLMLACAAEPAGCMCTPAESRGERRGGGSVPEYGDGLRGTQRSVAAVERLAGRRAAAVHAPPVVGSAGPVDRPASRSG